MTYPKREERMREIKKEKVGQVEREREREREGERKKEKKREIRK